jgi:hypothetical protein
VIIFSLRAFKGCEGKHVLVDDDAAANIAGQMVIGVLCSASGVPQKCRPDSEITMYTEIRVFDPSRLISTNPESAEWLKAFIGRHKK